MTFLKKSLLLFTLPFVLGAGQASDVTTLKPSAPNTRASVACHSKDVSRPTDKTIPAGHCIFRHVTLRTMIAQAYLPGIPAAVGTTRVTGGPAWIDSSPFDLDAGAQDPSNATLDQLHETLKTILKDRFQLAAHPDNREAEGYEMVPVSDGFKLSEVTSDPDPSDIASMRKAGVRLLIVPSTTLSTFADLLTAYVKAPVVDKTGIQGKYNFVVDSVETGDDGGPSIYTAIQEEVGLKLEPRKVPVVLYVIDHAEKPQAR